MLTGNIMTKTKHKGVGQEDNLKKHSESTQSKQTASSTYELSKEELLAWSKNQEEYANDYWMPDKAMQEGYKRAMKHLRYKLNNPVEYII